MEWLYAVWGFFLGFSIAGWIMINRNIKEIRAIKENFDEYAKSVEEYKSALNDMYTTVYRAWEEEIKSD